MFSIDVNCLVLLRFLEKPRVAISHNPPSFLISIINNLFFVLDVSTKHTLNVRQMQETIIRGWKYRRRTLKLGNQLLLQKVCYLFQRETLPHTLRFVFCKHLLEKWPGWGMVRVLHIQQGMKEHERTRKEGLFEQLMFTLIHVCVLHWLLAVVSF